VVEPEQVLKDPSVDVSTTGREQVIRRQRLPSPGVSPNFGPSFVPLAGGVGGSVGGENGLIQLLVGELQPRGAIVVEVSQRPLLEAGVLRGFDEDGRAADQRAGLGGDVGEVGGGVDLRGQGCAAGCGLVIMCA
jgi:hypothetical protein